MLSFLMMVLSLSACAAGRIQDADVKSLTEVGSVASRLINDTKIYATGQSKQLSQAIADGDLRGNSLVAYYKFAGTASCVWTLTNNTTPSAFSTDSDCPAPTLVETGSIGTPQTTDADLPQVTINSLPIGCYEVAAHGTAFNTTDTANLYIGINDGTNTRGLVLSAAGSSSGADTPWFHTSAVFCYGSSGNKTFAIYASGGSTGNISLYNAQTNNGSPGLEFIIKKL